MAHRRLSGDVGVGVEVDKETQRKKEGGIERKRCEESEMNGLGSSEHQSGLVWSGLVWSGRSGLVVVRSRAKAAVAL
ncbi:hypothetical protein E4U16_003357 [Claviceps sp. LM84 group G4]|nr:hypothetical protein E4U16_003357 [Claviceps sp. LM84 group G4]